jgi:hypothetical protein
MVAAVIEEEKTTRIENSQARLRYQSVVVEKNQPVFLRGSTVREISHRNCFLDHGFSFSFPLSPLT